MGSFDAGRGLVKDAQGSVVAELTSAGHVTNNGGQAVGTIEGTFSFSMLKTMAAYFLLVDPKFLRPVAATACTEHGILQTY